MGRDPTTDLALLSFASENLGVAPRELASPRLGGLVLAVGRPSAVGLSVSFGVVSSVGPEWHTSAGGRVDQFVQPDLTLYPGFSGGPLIDVEGRVLGVNTSGLSRGIPLAIPTETVERTIDQLLKRGTVSRGYLGLRMQTVELPQTVQSGLHMEIGEALLIVGLEPGGPADQAGVLVGDILLSVCDKGVARPESVQSLLDTETIGKALDFKILRGGNPLTLQITASERSSGRNRTRGHRG